MTDFDNSLGKEVLGTEFGLGVVIECRNKGKLPVIVKFWDYPTSIHFTRYGCPGDDKEQTLFFDEPCIGARK